MKKAFEIFIDGASRGNPGPAAVGVVIKEGERIVKSVAKSIGRATNNVAEYTALTQALEEAGRLKAEKIKFFTDSELLYHQVLLNYKVKNASLKSLFEKAQRLAKKFKDVQITLISREQNKEADRLAARALKSEQAKVVAPAFRATPLAGPAGRGGKSELRRIMYPGNAGSC